MRTTTRILTSLILLLAATVAHAQNAEFFGSNAPVAGGPAAITFVQYQGSTNHNTTLVTTTALNASTTPGNSLLVCGLATQSSGSTNTMTAAGLAAIISNYGGSGAIVAGSNANTGATTSYSNTATECLYVTGITNAATTEIQCQWTSTITGGACVAIEVTPGHSAVLYNAATGSTNAVSAGAVTTTVNGAFGIAIMGDDNVNGIHFYGAVGSGWTKDLDAAISQSGIGSEHQAQASSGSITGNSTQAFTGTFPWVASMIVIEP
jgi:hypothetical protein